MLVVCPVCNTTSKLVTEAELAVAWLVPSLQERVNSKIVLGGIHNRGFRSFGGHVRRQCIHDRCRALQLGFKDSLDRVNRSREFRRNLYHCHLDQAEHVVKTKLDAALAAFGTRPAVQTMDYEYRVHKFGSTMVVNGSGTTTREESNGRHAFDGRIIRYFLKHRVGASRY